MEFLSFLLYFLTATIAVNGVEQKCCGMLPNIPQDWIDLRDDCLSAMRAQIQMEIDASYSYMAMAAHFSRDIINRPGFAELFFKAAAEEREHAAKLIEYLSMRGKLTDDVTDLIKVPEVKQHDWHDGASALEDALLLEIGVTRAIHKLVKVCETDGHPHLVDYLTGVFLEEQLHGQRELAGKLMTLKKMLSKHAALGEFLFDKNLLDAIQTGTGGSHF